MIVRRVRQDEWRQSRDLRLDALRDPDAAIAFLDTYERASTQSDEFWAERTANASEGAGAAQFVAEHDGALVGTVTVLIREAGAIDHLDRAVDDARADVVGVFVRPSHRGDGTIDALFDAAATWAGDVGAIVMTLDVHEENARARAAYLRNGFTPTGETIAGPIGPEIVMARPVGRE
ncbi:GNAT family N-acetyltransferase [Humibacter ginsenosidimutans]|uniref:GNAT family N-acetyltransferase n=1 Tax=Humibacter ginsenosidimutans TaxID=2599293 RepID=A0A5B8M1D7_9MICO|nr:GNAT family N-acetyltransferase [Humibacter ginsenosidimutans]